MVCFKHGPPELTGVELEWTVHHRDDEGRPLDAHLLASALGDHAPPTVAPDSTHRPLPRGSLVTVEPGGQVEISSPPRPDLGSLVSTVQGDIAALDELLASHDLRRGASGIDAHRPPSRLLAVPRYEAMQQFFDCRGPWGSSMMCSTASTQVCVDAGEPGDLSSRWRLLHSAGPALVALFANSPVVNGVRTGWASNRLRATFGTCPPFTHPLQAADNPAESWVDRVMTAPVLCVRRTHGHWAPRRPMSFIDWIEGAGETAATYDDLDYHLSTLFPPVRPRGYVEVRYLDAQPHDAWHHPLVVISALLSSRDATDHACEATEETSSLWLTAGRWGLRDARLRRAARRLVELASSRLDPTLDGETTARLVDVLDRRTDPHRAHRARRTHRARPAHPAPRARRPSA